MAEQSAQDPLPAEQLDETQPTEDSAEEPTDAPHPKRLRVSSMAMERMAIDRIALAPPLTAAQKEQISQMQREAHENKKNPELCRKCWRARPSGGRTHRLLCGCLALCADCHEKMAKSSIIKDTTAVRLFCPATPQCTPQVTPPGTPH